MAGLIILICCAAYLCGSLSSAVLVCRAFRLPDPRLSGSGNPGATNVLRLGGRVPASLVLVTDVVKGSLPTYLGYLFGIEPVYLGFIAIAACLGHIFPLFFKFKGGESSSHSIWRNVAYRLRFSQLAHSDLVIDSIYIWLLFTRCDYYR